MNHIALAMETAAGIIGAAYERAVEAGTLPRAEVRQPQIEVPKDLRNGDYASGFAMQNAKALGMPPRKIAEELVSRMEFADTGFASAEVAGPGFLNLRLDHSWFRGVVENICAEGESYGRTQTAQPEKVMVEFVSANPTGPMHLGNARGGVLGDSLAQVLDLAGHEVSREFYINDAGNQVDKFAISLEARYFQLIHGEDAVAFPEDGYHGDDIRELAKAFREVHGDAYADKSVEERRAALAEFGLAHNIPKMKTDLERYNVRYDVWFHESELHDSGYVAETVEKLAESGYTYEKDGALWLNTSRLLREMYLRQGKKEADIEKLELKDDVLRRANGFYTYFAADIAYHRNKFEKRGFDRVINIWGADHHGHVARLKCALDALGLNGSERLEIVLMQFVNLFVDGQPVRMSKRTGKAISLSNLLDEVSIDAARFLFNSRVPGSMVDFDMGLAVRQDSENPVYYVQYAHARIHSILRALEQEGISAKVENPNLTLLTADAEIELIRELARLPEEIRLSAARREPSRMNTYATNVANAFHKFYQSCRIKGAESDALRDARIALCLCTAQVIKNTLATFGVSAPTRM
jgi:arginyl-tRNA synthetase